MTRPPPFKFRGLRLWCQILSYITKLPQQFQWYMYLLSNFANYGTSLSPLVRGHGPLFEQHEPMSPESLVLEEETELRRS